MGSIKIYYRLKVDAERAHYSNPGQFKPGALYEAESLFIYSDSRKPETIETVATKHQPQDWQRVKVYVFKEEDLEKC
jgi:hypothetical protein